jgi:hypothetical protein
MEPAYVGSLDQTTLVVLFRCVKQGLPLTEVCADLQLKVPTVLRALSKRASISVKTLKIALTMRENGKSLERISDLCEVPITSLLKILPGQVTEEKSPSSQAQVSHSIGFGQISEAVDLSSTEPARQELPKKRRATSSANTSKQCSDGSKKDTKKWPNGDSYKGQLLNDKPHGQGTKKYEDGSTYIGAWVNGNRQGRGVLTWPDGDKYEGDYLNGKRHGQGTYTWTDGSFYIGSWRNDNQHGYGEENLLSGASYKGEYRDKKRNGQGTYREVDGTIYEGLFKNDRKHGQGTQTWTDRRVYTGLWKDGQMHGHGVEVEPDGGHYIGTWKGDKKNGEFTYSKGGTLRKEKWTAGVSR